MISEWNEEMSLRVGTAIVKSNIFGKLPYRTHTHSIHYPSPQETLLPLDSDCIISFWTSHQSRANQLMVHCWFGARWFGILGVPLRSLSNNPFHKGIPNIQTTSPQITHLPLVEQTWRKNNHHPNLHGLAPIHPVTGDFSNAQVTWPRRKYS